MEEAERHAITGPPHGRLARSITMSYTYPELERDAPSEGAIHGGLAVPLPGEGSRGGYLSIFTRTPDRPFGEEDVQQLEALALRAAPAIENARRFREARQLADLDALTGLHNRRFFHETLGREVARAHRYQRNLALIVFDLDDFKLRPDDDAVTFFQRADDALYRAKDAGKGRVVAANSPGLGTA